jgi:hypothetical protein
MACFRSFIGAAALAVAFSGLPARAGQFASYSAQAWPTGRNTGAEYTGYFPNNGQAALVGVQGSPYARWSLVRGTDTEGGNTNSYMLLKGEVGSEVELFPVPDQKGFSFDFEDSKITDNFVGGVVVLDSLEAVGDKATVVFASAVHLVVMELLLGDGGTVSSQILKTLVLPAKSIVSDYYAPSGNRKRLTLLGKTEGANTVYHLALSHPYFMDGGVSRVGRVDFLSLTSGAWSLSQPNKEGIASAVGEMSILGEHSSFGCGLQALGDLDGNGTNDLAVLAPASASHPGSALYVFLMESPSKLLGGPVVLVGDTEPWKDCRGLGRGAGGSVLLTCKVEQTLQIKELRLNAQGGIASAETLWERSATSTAERMTFGSQTNPLWMPGVLAFALDNDGPYTDNEIEWVSVYDVDANKNHSVASGAEPAKIVSLDTLFYGGVPEVFDIKTLSGLVACASAGTAPTRDLACSAPLEAKGSWSMVEVKSEGCLPLRVCKTIDTLSVYTRDAASEGANFAFRFPLHKVLAQNSAVANWGNLAKLGVFQGAYGSKPSVAWALETEHATNAFENTEGEWLLAPLEAQMGTDTLKFTLSLGENGAMVSRFVHVVEPGLLVRGVLPQTPGEQGDTIVGALAGEFHELPLADEAGNLYTYDIAQSAATVYENWLKIEDAPPASVKVAYTHQGARKERTVLLEKLPEPEPSSSSAKKPSSSSSAGMNVPLSSSSEKEKTPVWGSVESPMEAPVSVLYFDLRGNRVVSATLNDLAPGVYIVRQGKQTRRVVVK